MNKVSYFLELEPGLQAAVLAFSENAFLSPDTGRQLQTLNDEMWLKGSGFQILQGEAGIFLVFQKYRKFFCTRDPEFAAGMEHYSPGQLLAFECIT